jgi:hypothetical protein
MTRVQELLNWTAQQAESRGNQRHLFCSLLPACPVDIGDCGQRVRAGFLLDEGKVPMLRTVLVVLLLLALLGAAPFWPYSSGWGYFPSLGFLLVLVVVLLALRDGPRGDL